MNEAQRKVEEIQKAQVNSIIAAIRIGLISAVSDDETFCGERISTFIFTYADDSQLRIDTEGCVYSDNDYQYQIYS